VEDVCRGAKGEAVTRLLFVCVLLASSTTTWAGPQTKCVTSRRALKKLAEHKEKAPESLRRLRSICDVDDKGVFTCGALRVDGINSGPKVFFFSPHAKDWTDSVDWPVDAKSMPLWTRLPPDATQFLLERHMVAVVQFVPRPASVTAKSLCNKVTWHGFSQGDLEAAQLNVKDVVFLPIEREFLTPIEGSQWSFAAEEFGALVLVDDKRMPAWTFWLKDARIGIVFNGTFVKTRLPKRQDEQRFTHILFGTSVDKCVKGDCPLLDFRFGVKRLSDDSFSMAKLQAPASWRIDCTTTRMRCDVTDGKRK